MDTSRHPGFRRIFAENRLTLGLMLPIEAYEGDLPPLERGIERIRRAEELGFRALWFRDVPLRDPEFGDTGQVYDVWVYLGYVAAHTHSVTLGTASVVITLRHPLHVAKAAASVDRLSGGRLVLGVASGDRPVEFPAFCVEIDDIPERFRESFFYLQRALEEEFPVIDSPLGRLRGADLVPKPLLGSIPLLITGQSGQTPEWIARHGDGWLYYPRHPLFLERLIRRWREWAAEGEPGVFKPFAQPLPLDLAEDPDTPLEKSRMGIRVGRHGLVEHLEHLRRIGVNHVIIGLKGSRRPVDEVMEELAEEVLPRFHM
ncbi:MAG: LLM class oxidoreductase [Alicyclobacillaceae bacterium]|nr:LLM class oxidoreductase [Alicyclobacillaceae bacterium]